MVYVALLRGINVGGKNKVDMKQLKAAFEQAGMTSVRTYINSGNVVFSSALRSRSRLVEQLEEAIADSFGFHVRVLIRDRKAMRAVGDALPKSWVNNASMKCDVMFLWDEAARPSIVKELPLRPEIDEVKYAAGAILWRCDAKKVTRSGLMKLAGTALYKQMTIRNCNTTRKLIELMES